MSDEEQQQWLSGIRDAVTLGQPSESISVREFISWFGARRRGSWINWLIRTRLDQYGIRTLPDFEAVHLDSEISFALTEPLEEAIADRRIVEAEAAFSVQPEMQAASNELPAFIVGAVAEPAFRVSRLLAAINKPLSVPPDCKIGEAVTLMLRHDYSQLPVMTNDREVKGVVSWESIGCLLALRDKRPILVRECMTGHQEVNSQTHFFGSSTALLSIRMFLYEGRIGP